MNDIDSHSSPDNVKKCGAFKRILHTKIFQYWHPLHMYFDSLEWKQITFSNSGGSSLEYVSHHYLIVMKLALNGINS
jgi:hypothetical protein